MTDRARRPPRRRAWAGMAALLLAGTAGCPAGPGGGGAGDRQALQRLNAGKEDERIEAVRRLADRAARERAAGHGEAAEHYAKLVIRRYGEERPGRVRAAVVALAAPVMGRGSPATRAFLRRCMADGPLAGEAAVAYATLGWPDAYALVAPMTAHPLPERRYQGALALAFLGDPRGLGPARRVLDDMAAADATARGWPPSVAGLPLADACGQLRARLAATFNLPEAR